jgi:FkbM family methyltransferase
MVFFMGITIGLMIGITASLNFGGHGHSGREPSLGYEDGSYRGQLTRLQKLIGTPDPPLDDSNFRSMNENLNLFARLSHLERKVNGGFNWLKNPHFYDVDTYTCKDATNFSPEAGVLGFYDHWVCLDKINLKTEKCVVYDFGIRQQPHFGEALARDYGCEVHAFDPSPITLSWIKSADVSKLPNYHFHPYGGGGVDGNVTLFEYWDWDQISIIKLPNQLLKEHTDGGKGPDRVNWQPPQQKIQIPVKTIPTIMKELGHDFVTILKVDIEGSEFLMLQDLLDQTGCPPIDQLTLEWHHFELDMRYGTSPHVNALSSMFHECGLHQFEHMTPYLREDAASHQEFSIIGTRRRPSASAATNLSGIQQPYQVAGTFLS